MTVANSSWRGIVTARGASGAPTINTEHMMKLFAYLDPGTGTIIVQAVLGGVAGVAVLFKTVGGRFRRKGNVDETIESTSLTEADEPSTPPVSGD